MIHECLNQFIKILHFLKTRLTYLFCMLCMYMWVPEYHCMYVDNKQQLAELVLSLQCVGSGGLSSGHKVWWHMPLPAEPSGLPLFKLFLSTYFSGIKYIHNLMQLVLFPRTSSPQIISINFMHVFRKACILFFFTICEQVLY